MEIKVRNVISSDIEGLKLVLDSINLFPSELLEEMITSYLSESNTQEILFTGTLIDEPVAIGYCVPEKLTDRTFNLLAIGVRQDLHSQGIGKKLIEYIENVLLLKEVRVLTVETSSDEVFIKTRQFYENLGYTKEAIIRDFWKEGEAKIIYWKKLI